MPEIKIEMNIYLPHVIQLFYMIELVNMVKQNG